MIILIDGPEKTGKSTMIKRLDAELTMLGFQVFHRHWGPVNPDDREYKPLLAQDSNRSDAVYIWDRAWPSEHVYGVLLARDRRLRDDPWLGEWLHRRALIGRGGAVILLPQDHERCAALRDKTDLPVNPYAEIELYAEYARRFHYNTYHLNYTDAQDNEVAHSIVNRFMTHGRVMERMSPDDIVGPWPSKFSPVLVVGDRISENPGIPGAWLPFTSRYTTQFARLFGDAALNVCWTNANSYPAGVWRGAQYIIACGARAQMTVEEWPLQQGQELIEVTHPAYAYRWGQAKAEKAEEKIVEAIAPAVEAAREAWKALENTRELLSTLL